MKTLIKTILISLLIVLVVSVAGGVYSFVREGGVNARIVFNANFAVGALIIGAALVMMLIPAGLLKNDKLSDHSTFAERVLEQRERKRKKAYGLLFIGIMMTVKTGLIQLAMALIDN